MDPRMCVCVGGGGGGKKHEIQGAKVSRQYLWLVVTGVGVGWACPPPPPPPPGRNGLKGPEVILTGLELPLSSVVEPILGGSTITSYIIPTTWKYNISDKDLRIFFSSLQDSCFAAEGGGGGAQLTGPALHVSKPWWSRSNPLTAVIDLAIFYKIGDWFTNV